MFFSFLLWAVLFFKNYFPSIISAAFSAIIMVGAFVFPATMVGIIDASTTLKASTL